MTETWQIILSAIGGAAGMGVIFLAVWQGISNQIRLYFEHLQTNTKQKYALEKIEVMRKNADAAVKAVDQMAIYKDLPKDQKQRMALVLATQLNSVAGIDITPASQVTLNEASVNDLHNVTPIGEG